MSDGVMLIELTRVLKYSFHLPGMSSWWMSKTPFWSLMDLAVLDFLPRRPHIVCQNHCFCLPVVVLPRLHFGLFPARFGFVLEPCLACYLWHFSPPGSTKGLVFCHYSPYHALSFHIPEQQMKWQLLCKSASPVTPLRLLCQKHVIRKKLCIFQVFKQALRKTFCKDYKIYVLTYLLKHLTFFCPVEVVWMVLRLFECISAWNRYWIFAFTSTQQISGE